MGNARSILRLGGVVLASIVASPSLAQGGTSTPAPPRTSDPGSCTDRVRVSKGVLPMMQVSMPCPRENGAASRIGGYTRIVVEFDGGPDQTLRDYGASARDKLRRFFAGKSISRVLTVKAGLARPALGATVPLVTVGHNSNRKEGETWITEVGSRRVLTPYFRIDPDSAINIEFALSAISKYDGSVASGLLDLVKRAVTLVTPTGALLTSLNSDRFEKAAQFTDQSIANFFRESIVEQTSNDFAAGTWAGEELATVALNMPMKNDLTPAAKAVDRVPVGRWIVRAEPAVLSIFPDARVGADPPVGDLAQVIEAARASGAARAGASTGDRCAAVTEAQLKRGCEALRHLDPEAVLNFEVDNGVTVAQALAGDAGITAARDALVEADRVAVDLQARNLCGLVANRAQALGFNRIDVAAILWAYSQGSFTTPAAGTSLRKPAVCAPLTLAYGLGLPADGF